MIMTSNSKSTIVYILTSKHIFVYSDSARNSRTLLIRQIYTRWLEARGLSEGEGIRRRDLAEASRRAKPCKSRPLRLGREGGRGRKGGREERVGREEGIA